MLFGFALIGIMWIGGSGESMKKTGLYMDKRFHSRGIKESFCGGKRICVDKNGRR